MNKLFCVFLLLCSILYGQTSVLSPTSAFNQVLSSTSTSLTDFVADQRTGQGQDDFVVNGFYKAYNYSLTNPQIIYRFRFDKYDSKGFVGNLRVGLDVNYDNAIDLYFGVSGNGSSTQITFQLPSTGVNNSPNTANLGTAFNSIAITATNYSYTQVDTATNDAWMSFSLYYVDISNALTGTGKALLPTTYVQEIAFTSTNTNSINQDLYGVNNGINSTTTFSNLGVFSEYRDFNGSPVPEPSTYGAIFVGLSLGLFFFKKYRE